MLLAGADLCVRPLASTTKRADTEVRPYNARMRYFRKTAGGVYVAYNCTVTGDVKIAPDASLWFDAVVRGDVAPVTIGRRTNVQDGAVVHCDTGVPNVIEDDVVIGHRAVVHGKFVGAGSLIGMGAVVLSGSSVGRGCLIAAGAVVPPNLEVPEPTGSSSKCRPTRGHPSDR